MQAVPSPRSYLRTRTQLWGRIWRFGVGRFPATFAPFSAAFLSFLWLTVPLRSSYGVTSLASPWWREDLREVQEVRLPLDFKASIAANGVAPLAATSSASWKDTSFMSARWDVAANWYSTIPGAAGTGDTNKDTATFRYGANLNVIVDASRSIASIVFDSSAAGAFTVGGGDLYVTFNSFCAVNSTVVNTETINSNIYLGTLDTAVYSLVNHSTHAGVSFDIGGSIIGRESTGHSGGLALGGEGDGSVTGAISNGSGGGVLFVMKSEAGVWKLSGANTYTGATSVSGGTLLINGNQSQATGAVTVASGSYLGGTGTIGGAVTINSGGFITGGSNGAVGALTLASTATFSGAASLLVDLAGAANDRLNISGALDLSSTTDKLVFNGSTAGHTNYVLATYGSLSGTFDSVSNLPAGYELIYGQHELDLISLTTVPEPGTTAPALLAVGALVWSLRYRVRRSC